MVCNIIKDSAQHKEDRETLYETFEIPGKLGKYHKTEYIRKFELHASPRAKDRDKTERRIPEKENNYEDLLKSILDIINTTMRIACPKWEIETVTRLGKYKNKTRPVVVTTTTTSRKLEILKQKKRLENTGIYIKEDYTPAVLIKRQELQEELQRRRTSGEKVMLRYDKIVQIKSRDKQTYATKSTNCNKRFLSESPETAHKEKVPNIEERLKQIPKKNKSQNITSFLKPSQFKNGRYNVTESIQNVPKKQAKHETEWIEMPQFH
ncbi:hypothetical protein HW555_007181 [Spodoptera exigua]|uniref:Endonuclease-reverse transcriptase n=1 Tax=Spodoptera exigua TaxID=7107 RepID=A0A835GGL8_SPOEX|nr:hypothetical protein HW555_007181 [Spodoptera exigua]